MILYMILCVRANSDKKEYKFMGVKKIVEKMEQQPNGIRFEEGRKVLEHYGFELV